MLRSLSRILASFTRSTHSRKPAPVQRRSSLGLEVLEGRSLPSASPLHLVASVPPVQQTAPALVHILPVNYTIAQFWQNQVPNLQGYSFHLISSNGKPAHDLVIQTETYNADGSATFTGTWKGDKGGGVNPITGGTLTFDAQGNISIWFSWKNGQNSLQGTITTVQNHLPNGVIVYGFHYHLDGNVTTASSSGGPGHVSGNGQAPPPVAKAAD